MGLKTWLQQKAETRIEVSSWEAKHTSQFVKGIVGVTVFSALSSYLLPLFGFPQSFLLIVFVLGSFAVWVKVDYERTGTLTTKQYYGLTLVILLLTFFFNLINTGLVLLLGVTIIHIFWRLSEGMGLPVQDVILASVLLGVISYLQLNSLILAILVGVIAVIGIFAPKFSVTVLLFLASIIGALVIFQRLPSGVVSVFGPLVMLLLFVLAAVLVNVDPWGGSVSLIILFLTVISLFWLGNIPGVERESILGKGATVMKESIVQIPGSIRTSMRNIQKSYEREIAYAKGDYAASQIDEDAKRDLGVRLEDLKASEERAYTGAPVSLYTTLTAEALDKPISILASCKIKTALGEEQEVELLGCEPGEDETCSIIVEGQESQELDCVAENLPAGTYTATVSTSFDFTTRSYLPVYLMEKNKLRELVRRNLDPLKGYDIKEPVATTTKGPVRVGIAVGTQPTGIGLLAGEPGPTIAVTIDNAWEGEVKEIKNVIIFLPKGIRITKIAGARLFGTPFKQTCEGIRQIDESEARICDETINAYTIAPEAAEETFGSFVSFRAYTVVGEGLELGPAPITTRNIRVSVLYNYLLEKEKVFTVEEPRRPEREQEIRTVVIAPPAEQPAIIGANS